MSISKNKVVKRKTAFFNLSSGSIKIVSILLGIVILILIGQGVYYLKLRRDLEIREEPRAPQVTPAEVDEEIMVAPEAEMYFEGPNYYGYINGEMTLLAIEGIVEEIDLQKKSLIIRAKDTKKEIQYQPTDVIYLNKLENLANPRELNFSDIKKDDFISYNPKSEIFRRHQAIWLVQRK